MKKSELVSRLIRRSISLSIALVAIGQSVVAVAQPSKQQRGSQSMSDPSKPTVMAVTTKEPLLCEERFDDIPQYTGKSRFVRGTKYEREQTTTFLEILHVAEPRDQVIDWYKRALTSIGWKVLVTDGALSGHKSGSSNTVNIIVNEIPLADKFRCELMVRSFRDKH